MTTQPPTRIWPNLVRAAVTLFTLAALAASVMLSTYRLPFNRADHGSFATLSALADAPLPPSLRPGDRIDFQEQSLRVRALLVAPNVPPGAAYPVTIHRGNQVLTVPISTIPSPGDGRFLTVVSVLTGTIISLLALLTLWLGKSWSAWGLTIFASSVLCSALTQIPLAPYGNIAMALDMRLLGGPLPFVGLFITTLDLTGRSVRTRPWLTAGFAAVCTGLLVSEVLAVVFMMAFGVGEIVGLDALGLCFAAVMLAIPLLVLTTGYVAADADQKLRIRWILSGTALLIPLLLTSFVTQLHLVTGIEAEHLTTILRTLLTGLTFAVYAYAVLSQRLVQVRIVINRALVFGTLMMMIVGTLGAAESLIERTAVGESGGAALEFLVPLALGVAAHRLHGWIEARVDQLLFRSEHRSRAALRDFVRDAGFIENADVLVRRMVLTFARHAGGQGAALYELRGGSLECSAQEGFAWPDLIDADDPAMVRLRATLTPLDLHEAGSLLGPEGLALPLALRGRIFGVLVCAPRPAGRYAQAEVLELGQSAHDVGASLFALRARANELLIERLAQGQMQADRAVIEARRLAGFI
jgi:hypothetical protein